MPGASPNLELKYTLLAIARASSEGEHARIVSQDGAEQRAIAIDLLGVARSAPTGANASYSRDESDGPAPLIPVRYMDGNRAEAMKYAIVMSKSSGDIMERGVDVSAVIQVKAGLQELKELMKLLEESSSKVSPAAHAAFRRSKLSHNGAFRLGYIGVPDPGPVLSPLPTADDRLPTCHAFDCSLPGDKRCSMCHGAFYCSAACQRTDWKARHRKECTGRDAAPKAQTSNGEAPSAPASSSNTSVPDNRESVIVAMGSVSLAPFMMTMSMKGGPVRYSEAGKVSTNFHKAEFIVKVQVNIEKGQPLLVYDQHKTFQEFVHDYTTQGATLARLVRSQGYMGRKVYLHAKRQ